MKTQLHLKYSLVIAALCACTSSFGFGFQDILNWTGTGSNEAGVVIDFHDGTQYQSFAWGYRWDGTATGESMMDAIGAADPQLLMQIQSYSFGDALETLTFNGSAAGYGIHTQSGFNTGTPGFWDYYLGNGTSIPSWTESGVGFGGETLSNQDWNGWSWAANFNSTPPSDTVYAAPQSVPEPSSVLLPALGIGVGLLLLKKRRIVGSQV